MPVYAYQITIPANTPSSSPYEVRKTVRGYELRRIIVLIPDGHFGLTGLRVIYGVDNIIPDNPDGWIIGNDESVPFFVYFKLPERETTLRFQGYNLDDTYDHSFYVRVEVLEEDEAKPLEAVNELANMLKKLLGLG